MKKQATHSDSFPIHTHMCGADRKVRLTAICHGLQEVAGQHAFLFDLGYEGMKENEQAWVLNRLRVQIERYPYWKEQLHIETWVQLMRGPFSQRMFLLKDGNGNIIGSASTLWVVIDTNSQKPQRLKSTAEIPVLSERVALCGLADKVKLPTDLPVVGTYRAKHSDLDLLHHVNNVKYTEWLLDTCASDQQSPKQIDINYMGQVRLNDEVTILSDYQFFQLQTQGKQEICKAEIKW